RVTYQTFRRNLKSAEGEIIYPLNPSAYTSEHFKNLSPDEVPWLNPPSTGSFPRLSSLPEGQNKERKSKIVINSVSMGPIKPTFPSPIKSGDENRQNRFKIEYRHNEIWSFELDSFEGIHRYSFDNPKDKYSDSVHRIASRLRTFDKFAFQALQCCRFNMSEQDCLRRMR
ncbi:MAG: hypothetical protein AB7P49_14150, partial [Bdellovibrionales bacterium]